MNINESKNKLSSNERQKCASYDVAIIGGGPAGVAVATSLLEGYPNFSFAIVDQHGLGGRLGLYDIAANSEAQEFVCVAPEGILSSVRRTPEAQHLLQLGSQTPNLRSDVGPYLQILGKYIAKLLPEEAISQEEVEKLVINPNRTITVAGRDNKNILTARYVVLATGAHERTLAETDSRFLGFTAKTIPAQEILTNRGLPQLEQTLPNLPPEKRKIIIVGDSHSAWATVRKLQKIKHLLPDGSITIAHKATGDTKIFLTPQEAEENGLKYSPDDPTFCPVTHRRYRFGGIRAESRDAYNEENGKLVQRRKLSDITHDDLNNAACIISAIGLQTNLIPIEDASGNPVILPVQNGQVISEPLGKINQLPIYGIGIGFNTLRPTHSSAAGIGGELDYVGYLHAVNVYNAIAPWITSTILFNDRLDKNLAFMRKLRRKRR